MGNICGKYDQFMANSKISERCNGFQNLEKSLIFHDFVAIMGQ